MNEETEPVMIKIKTLRRISKIITEYPEFGYKAVDEFVNDAAIDLLNLKSLQISSLFYMARARQLGKGE